MQEATVRSQMRALNPATAMWAVNILTTKPDTHPLLIFLHNPNGAVRGPCVVLNHQTTSYSLAGLPGVVLSCCVSLPGEEPAQAG